MHAIRCIVRVAWTRRLCPCCPRCILNSEKTYWTKGDLYGAAVTAKAKAGREFPCWIQPPDGFLYIGELRFNAVTGHHFGTIFNLSFDPSEMNRCLGISIESGTTFPGITCNELAFGDGIRNYPGLGVDGTSGKMLAAWASDTNGVNKGYLRELSSTGEPVASAVGALKNASEVRVESYGQGKYIVAYRVRSGSQYQIWWHVFQGTKPLAARGKIASSTNPLFLWDVSYNGSSSQALVTWAEVLSSGYSTIYGRIQSILE